MGWSVFIGGLETLLNGGDVKFFKSVLTSAILRLEPNLRQ